ncbi:hypothetical protein LDC_2293 [sediment metagenome]|uniref:J domain-containing protein n=1 Tax=sediment metagenome TaxID=749907 RepID=D9PL68_9ZZZZ
MIELLDDFLHNTGLPPEETAELEIQLAKFQEGSYRIYGFTSIVKGADDFIFDWHNTPENELFLATDLIAELENRGPPELADYLTDEYLLHTLICPILGHNYSIFIQQALFPQNYPDRERLKNPDEDKPYKGLLGESIRGLIEFNYFTLALELNKRADNLRKAEGDFSAADAAYLRALYFYDLALVHHKGQSRLKTIREGKSRCLVSRSVVLRKLSKENKSKETLERARESCEQAVKLNPENLIASLELAVVLDNLIRFAAGSEEARSRFEYVLSLLKRLPVNKRERAHGIIIHVFIHRIDYLVSLAHKMIDEGRLMTDFKAIDNLFSEAAGLCDTQLEFFTKEEHVRKIRQRKAAILISRAKERRGLIIEEEAVLPLAQDKAKEPRPVKADKRERAMHLTDTGREKKKKNRPQEADFSSIRKAVSAIAYLGYTGKYEEKDISIVREKATEALKGLTAFFGKTQKAGRKDIQEAVGLLEVPVKKLAEITRLSMGYYAETKGLLASLKGALELFSENLKKKDREIVVSAISKVEAGLKQLKEKNKAASDFPASSSPLGNTRGELVNSPAESAPEETFPVTELTVEESLPKSLPDGSPRPGSPKAALAVILENFGDGRKFTLKDYLQALDAMPEFEGLPKRKNGYTVADSTARVDLMALRKIGVLGLDRQKCQYIYRYRDIGIASERLPEVIDNLIKFRRLIERYVAGRCSTKFLKDKLNQNGLKALNKIMKEHIGEFKKEDDMLREFLVILLFEKFTGIRALHDMFLFNKFSAVGKEVFGEGYSLLVPFSFTRGEKQLFEFIAKHILNTCSIDENVDLILTGGRVGIDIEENRKYEITNKALSLFGLYKRNIIWVSASGRKELIGKVISLAPEIEVLTAPAKIGDIYHQLMFIVFLLEELLLRKGGFDSPGPATKIYLLLLCYFLVPSGLRKQLKEDSFKFKEYISGISWKDFSEFAEVRLREFMLSEPGYLESEDLIKAIGKFLKKHGYKKIGELEKLTKELNFSQHEDKIASEIINSHIACEIALSEKEAQEGEIEGLARDIHYVLEQIKRGTYKLENFLNFIEEQDYWRPPVLLAKFLIQHNPGFISKNFCDTVLDAFCDEEGIYSGRRPRRSFGFEGRLIETIDWLLAEKTHPRKEEKAKAKAKAKEKKFPLFQKIREAMRDGLAKHRFISVLETILEEDAKLLTHLGFARLIALLRPLVRPWNKNFRDLACEIDIVGDEYVYPSQYTDIIEKISVNDPGHFADLIANVDIPANVVRWLLHAEYEEEIERWEKGVDETLALLDESANREGLKMLTDGLGKITKQAQQQGPLHPVLATYQSLLKQTGTAIKQRTAEEIIEAQERDLTLSDIFGRETMGDMREYERSRAQRSAEDLLKYTPRKKTIATPELLSSLAEYLKLDAQDEKKKRAESFLKEVAKADINMLLDAADKLGEFLYDILFEYSDKITGQFAPLKSLNKKEGKKRIEELMVNFNLKNRFSAVAIVISGTQPSEALITAVREIELAMIDEPSGIVFLAVFVLAQGINGWSKEEMLMLFSDEMAVFKRSAKTFHLEWMGKILGLNSEQRQKFFIALRALSLPKMWRFAAQLPQQLFSDLMLNLDKILPQSEEALSARAFKIKELFSGIASELAVAFFFLEESKLEEVLKRLIEKFEFNIGISAAARLDLWRLYYANQDRFRYYPGKTKEEVYREELENTVDEVRNVNDIVAFLLRRFGIDFFNITEESVRRAGTRLMASVHPDRFPSANEEEKEERADEFKFYNNARGLLIWVIRDLRGEPAVEESLPKSLPPGASSPAAQETIKD